MNKVIVSYCTFPPNRVLHAPVVHHSLTTWPLLYWQLAGALVAKFAVGE